MVVLRRQFEGIDGQPFKLNFHLAPPLLARPDPVTGRAKKIAFGPWKLAAARAKWAALLARLRGQTGPGARVIPIPVRAA